MPRRRSRPCGVGEVGGREHLGVQRKRRGLSSPPDLRRLRKHGPRDECRTSNAHGRHIRSATLRAEPRPSTRPKHQTRRHTQTRRHSARGGGVPCNAAAGFERVAWVQRQSVVMNVPPSVQAAQRSADARMRTSVLRVREQQWLQRGERHAARQGVHGRAMVGQPWRGSTGVLRPP